MKSPFYLTVSIFTLSLLINAATIHVPLDYATIQEAIDASVNGDAVLVAPGTYVENIDFNGKDILVKSSGGAAVTTIDGSSPSHPDLASVVSFTSGESLDAVLEGFTIAYGQGTRYKILPGVFVSCGGGVFCFNASPTIKGNVIAHNTTNLQGGGIYCKNSNAVIFNNTIEDNTAILIPVTAAAGGGGIYCENASCTITRNVIANNSADPGSNGGGGGVYCYNSFTTLSENTVHGNSAYAGGGILCQPYTCLITGNTMTGNVASFRGGGLLSDAWTNNSTIEFNSFYNNVANNGGGMFVIGDHTVSNNVVSNNTADDSGGGISFIGGDIINTNNIVKGNKANRGGGMYILSRSQHMVNNMIHGNAASDFGGGLCLLDVENTFMVYNTITCNTAVNNGGGITCTDDSYLTAVNTILWNNEASSGREIWLGYMYSSFPSTVEIGFCDLQDGISSIHVETGNTLTWGSGMIDADPQFVDEAQGDLHLLFTSPCKEAGIPMSIFPDLDFEGNPRYAYSSVDIGADEFYPHLYITGDAAPGGNVEGMILGPAGTTPVGLFVSSGLLTPPYFTKWGLFYLETPLFLFELGPIPSNGLLRVPATLPLSPPAPYDLHLQALVGLKAWESLTQLCVLEVR